MKPDPEAIFCPRCIETGPIQLHERRSGLSNLVDTMELSWENAAAASRGRG